ncbi:uncharacterized protein LOC127849107 [Dreissena polymorpha]|uniref:uncharacterized protein LOC127849107 n=1 Tax=Dreissena polymorpha TaxID=45954 RepID=UPI0022648F6D|nr:uncharacterized protein LOC127849107 [Dreissena polymorpha]
MAVQTTGSTRETELTQGAGSDRSVVVEAQTTVSSPEMDLIQRPEPALVGHTVGPMPEVAVGVDGGIAVFCDPPNYQREYPSVTGFGSAVGLHPKAPLRDVNGISDLAARFDEVQKTAVRGISADRLLVETDSPYLRVLCNKDNIPANVGEVANVLSQIRRVTLSEILRTTAENGRRLYNL